jgi:hypothetical protein
MTILLGHQHPNSIPKSQHPNTPTPQHPNRIVIPTEAQRSGVTCCFFLPNEGWVPNSSPVLA